MLVLRPLIGHFANVSMRPFIMFAFHRLISRTALIALTAAFSGCVSTDFGNKVWYKPNGTVQERDHLLAGAQVQAAQALAAYAPDSPNVTVDRKQTERHTILTFMTAAGWSLVPKGEAGPLGSGGRPKGTRDSHTEPLSPHRSTML
jgi:hypothetical protein